MNSIIKATTTEEDILLICLPLDLTTRSTNRSIYCLHQRTIFVIISGIIAILISVLILRSITSKQYISYQFCYQFWYLIQWYRIWYRFWYFDVVFDSYQFWVIYHDTVFDTGFDTMTRIWLQFCWVIFLSFLLWHEFDTLLDTMTRFLILINFAS